ncbi:hypothetical protein R1sor_025546 [Riccia sorocarpa]|uniref:Glycosyltransferase family 92 protein n=1 Tax=Riccia sorocarpa TaxID=122646 RepID=A0ABD3G8X6_9MARC
MGWTGEEPTLRRERSFVRASSMEFLPSRYYGTTTINRKPVDSMGFTLSLAKRMCFSLAIIGLLLMVSSLCHGSFSALYYPGRLVSTQENQPLPVNYLRTNYELVPARHRESVSSLAKPQVSVTNAENEKIRSKTLSSFAGTPPDPLAVDGEEQQEQRVEQSQPYIEDIVSLPENLDLVLIRQFADRSLRNRVSFCRYGVNQAASKIINADYVDGRLAVTCTRPEEFAGKTISVANITVEVDDGDGEPLKSRMDYEFPATWNAPLVYSVLPTEDDVVLFVKGLFDRRKLGDYTNLTSFRCVFGSGIETEVTAGAQEVYRCATPEFGPKDVPRQKVYLRYRGRLIPSVAYYDRSKPKLAYQQIMSRLLSLSSPASKHLICSCTMIWNAAKFMKEWVLYNSHLGVEKFFLYDNNSEDDIESVVELLRGYNVSRHFWPWVKTQEAGFSHCAVRAQKECVWMLYTDVDEFLFPKYWMVNLKSGLPKSEFALADTSTRSVFKGVIKDSVGKVASKMKLLKPTDGLQTLGQISFFCRNFGPSGLTQHPPRGVTQGYTCRDEREQRHKSLVLLKAMKPSLANVIHHFDLKPQYTTVYTDPRQGVVNHYKFQAWTEFESKFTKRASTYVANWKEPVNLHSRDRPEGVGPEGVKPEDWESSHCFKNDTALKNYMKKVFRVKDGENAGKLEWELL